MGDGVSHGADWLGRAIVRAAHGCWIGFLGDVGCWEKCGVDRQLHCIDGPGRNLFRWLITPREQRRWNSKLNFAKIRPLQGSSTGGSSSSSFDLSHSEVQQIQQFSTDVAIGTGHNDIFVEEEADPTKSRKIASPVTKEELGRATWTFLHTLAAQYPDKPTRQQQKDVKELMAILSRMYPCKECADHFKEVLKSNPVKASSGIELAQWMCRVHNVVNRSLGKNQFPCQRVDARWGALHCDEGCDLQGRKA